MKTLFGWPWLQALLLGVLLAAAPQARADCVLDAPGLVLLNRYDPFHYTQVFLFIDQ